MRLACLLLAGLFLVLPAASAAEISLLKGTPITGDILSVSDTQVVYRVGGVEKKLPIANVLKLEYRDIAKPAAGAKYSLVELTDGSILKANDISIKKRQVEMTLLAGPKVSFPLSALSNLLVRGESDKNRSDWKSRVFNTKNQDAFVVNREGTISSVLCTFGEGSEDGKLLNAAVVIGAMAVETKRKLASDHGFIFKYTLAPKAPPAICKLFDTLGDFVIVSSVVPGKDGGVVVKTPSGVSMAFTQSQLARLDYSTGKLDFLSDLVPTKIVAKSNLDEDPKPDQWHVYKDTNLNKGKITLGGTVYTKGLALKPFAELSFNLRGEYRDLSLIVGVDDNVSASGASILIIEGDGKELAKETVASSDKVRFKTVKLNIKDVRVLKITVKSAGLFDTGRHLDLADIKVSK